MKRAMLFAAVLAAIAPAAQAQQIVAQSNFVNRQQQGAIPQVSITVRADFVLFSVRFESATRAADARQDELAKTFAAITQRASRAEGMSIEVGQPGMSASIETAAIKEMIQNQGDDRSAISIVLKVMVRPNETFDAIRARAERFVKDTPLTGRVEAVIGDNQFLGISEPKKHRDTLVKAIAEDVRMMQSSFGGSATPVSVNLSGMEARTLTRPVGPLDLEIYIPYSMSVRSGAGS
ncbi:MAG TPA: hypothetical protein VIA80_13980 [Hyphomonadaceae bacterium]|jgi:hypothetical protein